MATNKDERTLLYLDNGEDCKFDNWTFAEAKKELKKNGYKKAYSGRKLNASGIKVLVGINEKNTVKLEERRKNGLYKATIINI